jgi:hypothetical protein
VGRSRKRPPKGPTDAKLTIAIVGEGVTPKNVTLRQLAALLEATATTFDALAADRNIEAPHLSLTRVKDGSAAYELHSQDRQASRAIDSFVATIRRRGKNASPRTRASLTRLHAVVTKAGASLRIDPVHATTNAKPIYLAAPLAEDDVSVEEGTVVFGRIVGLRLDARDRASVTIRYDDGGTGEFDAEADFLDRAARLIGRTVSARVTFHRGDSKDYEGMIEDLEERPAPVELMTAIAKARAQLAERGIVISAKEWLAEERDDD